MRNAYALLGLTFLIVFGGAYLLIERAEAPTPREIALEDIKVQSESMALTLTSPVFSQNGIIPFLYTCDGENVNPPLAISGVPQEAGSLVLVMDDPDIPQEVKDAQGIEKYNHWAVYNIPTDTTEIEAGAVVGMLAQNSSGEAAYAGPCPPPQYEPTEHRYIFRLYALPGELSFSAIPSLDEVEDAAKAQSIESTELIGVYDRSSL